MLTSIASPLPTRFIIIAETGLDSALPSLSVVARFPARTLPISSSSVDNWAQTMLDAEVCVAVLENVAAGCYDPPDWSSLSSKLSGWMDACEVMAPESVDSLSTIPVRRTNFRKLPPSSTPLITNVLQWSSFGAAS